MVPTGHYEVRPEAMRAAAGNVGGIIMQTVNIVLDLEALLLEPTSFASIGGAVASANTALRSQQIAALRSLLELLQEVNDLVKRAADDYDAADRAVAAGYGGRRVADAGTGGGLWSSPAAAALASLAVGDGAGKAGQPHSASTVVGYLMDVGLRQPDGPAVPTDSAHEFTSWLDASPDHQAGLGVIGVYAGAARGFGDVPGGVHNGDLVIIDPSGAADTTLGIIGNSNQLYNGGLLQPDFGQVATLRVYRPV